MIIGFTLLWEAILKLENAKMQDSKKNICLVWEYHQKNGYLLRLTFIFLVLET